MAIGRMLLKSISSSQRQAELSSNGCRLFYTWLLAHLDSRGSFYAAPELLKGSIVPLLKDITEADIALYIAELGKVRLIRRYKVAGKEYLNIPDFAKQPHIDAREQPKFPLFNKRKKNKNPRETHESSGNTAENPRNPTGIRGTPARNIIEYNVIQSNVIKGEAQLNKVRAPFESFLIFMKNEFKNCPEGKASKGELFINEFEARDLKMIYDGQKDHTIIGKAWLAYIKRFAGQWEEVITVKSFIKNFNSICQKM